MQKLVCLSSVLPNNNIGFIPFPNTPFETVPNSKKVQTTTEMWQLKESEIQMQTTTEMWQLKESEKQIASKTLWQKVKLLILSNFTFFHNVFQTLFSLMC